MTEFRGSTIAIARFPTFFFALALIGATSRGLFELLFGKTTAYGVQVGLIALFVVVLLIAGRPRPGRHFVFGLVTFLIFAIVALVSAFVSSQIEAIDYATPFLLVMIFFTALLFLFSSIDVQFRNAERIGPVIVGVVLLQIAVAVLQQFGRWRLLPGTDAGTFRTSGGALRPSGLTGAFLHYPIMLALLAFILLALYVARRHWIYLVTAILAIAAVVASYSRSGIVLVIVGLVLGIAALAVLGRRLRTVLVIIGGIGVVLLLLPTDVYVDRFFSIFNVDSGGNATRIDVWGGVIDTWLSSPILIGSHTGEYTNVTSRIGEGGGSGVAESGVLELLVNFGLLGLLAFYGLMVLAILATPRSASWMRAGLVAGIVQSFFYQSIEIVPFMAIYAMAPLIGRLVLADRPAAPLPVPAGELALSAASTPRGRGSRASA